MAGVGADRSLVKSVSAVYQERYPRPSITPAESALDPKPPDKTLSGSAFRPQAAGAADLDDAAGRPLSAGISRSARQGGRLSRSLLHAGIRRRSHAAADPPVQLRRRHHLLGHLGDSLRARP